MKWPTGRVLRCASSPRHCEHSEAIEARLPRRYDPRKDGSTNRPFASSAFQLRQHALKLHRVGHVALDLELAHHEGRHAVELSGCHLLPVIPADPDGGVGSAILFGHLVGDAVEHHRALLAEIDLHALARHPGAVLLHLRHEFLLGHRLLSPLSVAVASASQRHNILSVAKQWGGGPLSEAEWWR